MGGGTDRSSNRLESTWPTSCLVFSTDGSGLPRNNSGYASFIDARSSEGFTLDGLGVAQTSLTYDGSYLDLSHSGLGGDSAYARVRNCVFFNAAFNGVNAPITAKAHIVLSGAIICTVEKCFFARALTGIRGTEALGNNVSYSNIMAIRDCTFVQTPIAICNPGENWMIESNTAEGLQQSAADYLHNFIGDDLVCSGYIQELNKASHANGDTVTFDDGSSPATVFEYRVTTGSVTPGNVMVDISGATTAAECSVILAAAIAGAGLRLASARETGLSRVAMISSLETEPSPYAITASAVGQTVDGMATPQMTHDLVTVRNNWCGDAFGDQVWIRLLPTTTTVIDQNLFSGGVTALEFYENGGSAAACGAVSIRGNAFSVGTGIDFGAGFDWNGADISCNDFTGCTTAPTANQPSQTSVMFLSNRVLRANSAELADPTLCGAPIFGAIDPADITSASPLEAWWKADAIVGLSNGDTVATWEDSGANNHDLTQATAGNRPTYRTNGRNGRPVVRFDGTNDSMAAAFYLAAPFTVLIVFSATGSRVGDDTVIDGVNLDGMRLYRDHGWTMNAGGVALGHYAQQWGVYCLEQNGAASGSSVQRVGEINTSKDTDWSTGGTGGVTVGARANGALPMACDVAEVIVFNRPLYPDERKGAIEYLRAKWGCL